MEIIKKYTKSLPENRPKCQSCNKNLGAPSGEVQSDGTRYYRPECTGCINLRNHGRRNANKKQWHKRGFEYRRYKKDQCEKCGFKGHACQLDVDHADGNHQNNEITNLQTLCANCHRLKSWESKETYNKQWRGNA